MRVIGAALTLGATAASAGLSLDEAIERNRVLGEGLRVGRSMTPITLVPTQPDGITFSLGGPGKDVPPLLRPEARGDGGVQLRAHTAFFDDAVEVRFGGAWWPGDVRSTSFDESSVSTSAGLARGRVYASVERRHWGPAWTSSLILDAGSRAVPAVGWRSTDPRPFNTVLLSWLGPWTADFFAGQLTQRIGPERPHLLGGRFQFMPISNLELGVSRAIQWGGSGRPENFHSFSKAILGIDNNDSPDDSQEPGNQLAGFDARYTLRLGESRSASVYIQAIGEDEAGHRPDHYLATFGADTAFRLGGAGVRVFAEYSNTTCSGAFKSAMLSCAYVHHIYIDGYTQLGRPLGQPAGGDVLLTSVGAFVDRGAWTGALQLHHGRAYPTATLYGKAGALDGVNLESAWRINAVHRVGVALFYWRDPLASHPRGQVYWQVALP